MNGRIFCSSFYVRRNHRFLEFKKFTRIYEFFFVSLVEHHFSFVVLFCSLRSWQLFLRKSKMLENMFQVLSSLRSVIVVIFLRWLSFSFEFHRCKYVLLCSLFSLIFVNSNAITISFCSTTLKDTMRWFPWNHWKKIYILYRSLCRRRRRCRFSTDFACSLTTTAWWHSSFGFFSVVRSHQRQYGERMTEYVWLSCRVVFVFYQRSKRENYMFLPGKWVEECVCDVY